MIITELLKRKKLRLDKYDYSNRGYYFITICTKDKKCILSEIINYGGKNEILLTDTGLVVEDYIMKLENTYEGIVCDEYVIMPNHIHIILGLKYKDSNLSMVINQFKGMISR